VPATGGDYNFQVTITSGSNCSWNATSNDSWISITSGGGTGTGSVNYHVDENTSTDNRSGTITVTGSNISNPQTFTITQAGVICSSMSLSQTVQSVPGGGGNGYSFTVIAPNGCNWSATSNDSWITITSGTGNGNGQVTYNVASNSGSARTGTISIAGLTFTVNQDIGVKVEEIESLLTFDIHPNPNDGNFTVDFEFASPENITITLYNVVGKQCFIKKVRHVSGRTALQIEAENLPGGMYLLEMRVNKQGSVIKKVVITDKK